MNEIPLFIHTDSYKISHINSFPEAKKMSAYCEFRHSFEKDQSDQRMIFWGLNYIVKKYLYRKWTMEDVENSVKFLKTHNVGYTPYPDSTKFPDEIHILMVKVVKEYDGYFPIKVESLDEGSIVYPHTPVFIISAESPFHKLLLFWEPILLQCWYSSTVATLSRKVKDIIRIGFDKSVEDDVSFLLDSRLHDFGFRACTCLEQAIIGGTAHLLNFAGTDTLPAAYNVQYNLNGGRPIGTSIPATEHSVIMAHRSEIDAFTHFLDLYGHNICAIVMDTYDYDKALFQLLPIAVGKFKNVHPTNEDRKGFVVLRPDSGDPLEAGENIFGAIVNSKGYKVIKGCGVIQGDGLDIFQIDRILKGILEVGYSAQNVSFGMGGGLLQKICRDSMSVVLKINYIEYTDRTSRDVMKTPKNFDSKISIPGQITVIQDHNTDLPVVYPLESMPHNSTSLMKTIYHNGPTDYLDNLSQPGKNWFSEVRDRLEKNWEVYPKIYNPISQILKDKIEKAKQNIS